MTFRAVDEKDKPFADLMNSLVSRMMETEEGLKELCALTLIRLYNCRPQDLEFQICGDEHRLVHRQSGIGYRFERVQEGHGMRFVASPAHFTPIKEKPMISTFDHQTPSPQEIARIEKVRQAFRTLEQELFSASENPPVGCVMPVCSFGRMTSLAKTKLEEACMWAIKGIVFEDKGLA